jgi:hypothetical protein
MNYELQRLLIVHLVRCVASQSSGSFKLRTASLSM